MPVRKRFRAKPANEDAFLSFLNKKVTKDTKAKKKAAAEKVRSAMQPLLVQPLATDAPQSPLEVQPIYASSSSTQVCPQYYKRNRLSSLLEEPNQHSSGQWQEVHLHWQSAVSSRTATHTHLKPGGNGGATLQVTSSNQKLSASPFGKVDPHSALSPRDLAAKTTSPLMEVLSRGSWLTIERRCARRANTNSQSDVAKSENENRRSLQTAEMALKTFLKKVDKRNKATQDWAKAHEDHNREVELKKPEEHPYKPIIDVYLGSEIETQYSVLTGIDWIFGDDDRMVLGRCFSLRDGRKELKILNCVGSGVVWELYTRTLLLNQAILHFEACHSLLEF
ncbi:unnamed protein product [Calypogeia fissa]